MPVCGLMFGLRSPEQFWIFFCLFCFAEAAPSNIPSPLVNSVPAKHCGALSSWSLPVTAIDQKTVIYFYFSFYLICCPVVEYSLCAHDPSSQLDPSEPAILFFTPVSAQPGIIVLQGLEWLQAVWRGHRWLCHYKASTCSYFLSYKRVTLSHTAQH